MPVRTAASRQLLLGAILGAGLAGCDSQVDPSYPGEPIVELRGTAIGFRTDDAAGSVAIAWNSNAGPEIPSGPVTSESLRAQFPADLTIDVLARPPEAAFFAVEGEGVRIAEGYLYLVRAGAGRPPAGADFIGQAFDSVLVYIEGAVQPGTLSALYLGGVIPAGYHLADWRATANASDAQRYFADRCAGTLAATRGVSLEEAQVTCRLPRRYQLSPAAADLSTRLLFYRHLGGP
jgi:hypothetical protein